MSDIFVNTKDFEIQKDDYLEPDKENEGFVKKLELEKNKKPIDHPNCIGKVKTIIKYNYSKTVPVSKLLLIDLIN